MALALERQGLVREGGSELQLVRPYPWSHSGPKLSCSQQGVASPLPSRASL